jgi:hypothetical protein
MQKIIKHILFRLTIAAVPIFILINKKLNNISGNSGIGVDLPMIIAFLILLIWGIFIVYETGRFFYFKKNKLALINLLIIVPVLSAFIYVGGM